MKTAAAVSTKSHGDDDCDCGGIDEDSDVDDNNIIIRSWPLAIVVRRPLILSALSTKGFRGLSHMPTHARRTHTLACRRRRCRFARHRAVDVNINWRRRHICVAYRAIILEDHTVKQIRGLLAATPCFFLKLLLFLNYIFNIIVHQVFTVWNDNLQFLISYFQAVYFSDDFDILENRLLNLQ